MEIEFELKGLKLKIKGDSNEITGKVADLQRQMQGVVSTVAAITQGAAAPALPAASLNGNGAGNKTIDAPVDTPPTPKRIARRTVIGRPRIEAIDFKHDPEKFGYPKQDWSAPQKAMWVLHILEHSTNEKEFSASVIAATFNKHYKSFGTIRASNLSRDLNLQKGKGWISSDTTKDPELWYLLEEGKKGVAQLITEAKKPA